MNIIEAIRDENLFKPFLADEDGSLKTWRPWLVALRVLYGLPVNGKFARKLIRQCMGRDIDKLPKDGFQTALFLTGRRSGKSRVAALIGAYSATLAGLEKRLSPGEMGLVPVISPSKNQSRVVKEYLRSIFDVPMLRQEIVSDDKWHGFELRNGNRIELLAGDYRKVRGFSLLCAVLDEVCFMGIDDETTKIRSDAEIVRAIQPSLSTTGGKLIAISSPYAKRGWAYSMFQKHFGNDSSDVLTFKAPSRRMNCTLPKSVVCKAMKEDMAAAKSEYMGEFRDDISAYIPREVIENLVVKNRFENLPSRIPGNAFVDISGGRHDGSALCIAHKDRRTIIVDLARLWRSPLLNPYAVVADMCDVLRQWGIHKVTGDNFGADFVKSAFEQHGIRYSKCDKPKSALYAELLPALMSGEIELLDNQQLVKELCRLERRTRSGGKDIIDKPVGATDDLANSVAGVALLCNTKRLVACAGGY